MKKKLLFGILSMLLLVSCDYYKNHRLDGMWQLKTIKDSNGNETQVDTVFYSFQNEVVFSFTVTADNSKSVSYPYYGYMDMPSVDKVHVLIDRISDTEHIESFLSLSGWSSADIIFDIKDYTNKNLVLFDSESGNTFTLKKF